MYHPRALAVAAQRETMLPEYFSVDVVMERIALHNRWTSEQWRPAAVDAVGPGRADTAAARAPTCIEDTPERTLWRFRGARDRGSSDRGGGLLPQRLVGIPRRFRDVAHARRRRRAACRALHRHAELQRGRPLHGRRRARRPGADERPDPRLARRVRRGALQARAQEEGEAQRPLPRRRVPPGIVDGRDRPVVPSPLVAAQARGRARPAPRACRSGAARRGAGAARVPHRSPRRAGARAAEPPPLPPVESLTLDFRLQAVPVREGRRDRQARGLAQALQRPALQRDGRPRHLHRRLFDTRSRCREGFLDEARGRVQDARGEGRRSQACGARPSARARSTPQSIPCRDLPTQTDDQDANERQG